MRTLNFFKEELLNNKKIFLLLFFECLFTFLICGFCASYLLDSYASLRTIEKMKISENCYYIFNNGDSNQKDSGDYMYEEWNEFYKFVTENYNYIMNTGELLQTEEEFIWDNGAVDHAIGISYDTENYSEYLYTEKIIDYDWDSYEGDYIPVVMGYDYKKYYHVWDIIDSKWEVVDFCKKSCLSVPMGNSYKLTEVGRVGVSTLMKYYSSEGFMPSATEICVFAENPRELIPILEKFGELGLASVIPISFPDKINYMIAQFYKVLFPVIFIASGIVIFSVFCASSGFGNYMQHRKRDYLICEICGANVYGIACDFALLTFTVIFIPAIISGLIFGRADLIPIFLIISAVIEICSLARPLYGLLKKPLIEQYSESR